MILLTFATIFVFRLSLKLTVYTISRNMIIIILLQECTSSFYAVTEEIKSFTYTNVVLKIKINRTLAKNMNATFVENPWYYPKSPEEEILAIQKDHYSGFRNIGKKNASFEHCERSCLLDNRILGFQ